MAKEFVVDGEIKNIFSQAGLDLANNDDVELFRKVVKESDGGFLSDIAKTARNRVSGISLLERAFANIGKEEVTILPQEKSMVKKTGHETLDDYFNAFQKSL